MEWNLCLDIEQKTNIATLLEESNDKRQCSSDSVGVVVGISSSRGK